ncbi:DUF2380 domain-containing protein [Archangium sp.]|uniref:DUF2380 domain-containing protein n=1 Tax=Archangium sp. TaxID=1872627 RepID=UPI002D61EC00|nr:DUF2380 domain-containing protein [Archangium sp.]HYO57403.1 DUF2380 domain-containing protein [Archangium sp.]
MHADSMRARWAGLMLTTLLVSTGCVSLTPPSDRRMNLSYTPHEAASPASAEGPGVEPPRTLASPPEPEAPEPLHPRRASREDVTAGPGDQSEAARQSALAAHLAFLGAVGDVSGSTRRISGQLSRLQASHLGIAGRAAGVFLPYVSHGQRHLRWIDAQLAASTRLAHAASQVDDPDMQLALLRLAGPRLEASMSGSLLLAIWLDFLNLVDVVLKQGFNSVETLFANMDRWRKMMEPAMTALSSLEPGQVEAAANDLPALMGHLSGEFHSTAETIRVAMKRGEQAMLLAQLLEMVTSVSALKMSLPRLPPAAPATLGVGLVAGSNGVMMGTQVVVSAEWVEMMRRLVRSGVLSLPAVSAAVRIHAGKVMMAEAHDELPRGVREALGDGPEVRGMRVTDKAGAGMAEPPRHHVLPKEFREWFEKRGFTGEMDIDQFCVKLEQSRHEAIHGGGNWRLGRTWPDEWNRMIMDVLRKAETESGRMLTRNEILRLVAKAMRRYNLPMNFTPGRGR